MKKLIVSIFITLLLFSCEPINIPKEDPSNSTTNSVPEATAPIIGNNAKIKIGSFNMQIFGNTKVSRTNTLSILASTANQFDILALQEVGSNNSVSTDATCTTIMDKYLNEINSIAKSPIYSYIRGNQYAIIYRNDKFNLLDFDLYSGSKTFSYTPLQANFSSKEGNLDFSIITIHTSPDKAKTVGPIEGEISALKTVITETVNLYNENDVICLGDYNADGTYYSEGDLTSPFLFDFENGYITGIPNSADTTVATSSNTYDRIQMTNSMASDYTNIWQVFNFKSFFDVSICEGTTTTNGTEAALSDHYPVWCEYFVDKDKD